MAISVPPQSIWKRRCIEAYRTTVDRFLSFFSAAVFERLARKKGGSPTFWRVQAFMGFAIAAVFLMLAIVNFVTTAKHFYLESYGADAVGTITGRSFHVEHGRQPTPYETLTYEFTTRQGRTIQGKLDRPVYEVSGIADREKVTVAYWERFPTINSPRGVRRAVGMMIVLGLFLVLASTGFARYSWRAIAWAASISTESAVINSPRRPE
jgi:hypothetical protein